jgi:AraC-like DNA-binding protein
MEFTIDQWHPSLLNVGLAIHNADWNWKNVSSPFTRLFYVKDGNAQVVLPEGTFTLQADHLYCIPAFTIHSYICRSHFELYYLHIYEDRQRSCELLRLWEFPFEIGPYPMYRDLFERLCHINPQMMLKQSNPAAYDNNSTLIQSLHRNKQRTMWNRIESRGIVYQLVANFLSCAKPRVYSKDKRIDEAIVHIRQHIYDDVSLDQLASIACLSKDHFIRLFKQEMGITPQKYINQKKMEQAQLLLVTGDSAVKNIAYDLGIEDYSYFNRLFKKHTGTTPQKYRDSYR